MKCNFSFEHYREILKLALKAGFTITSFRDFLKYQRKSKLIILRHDVDYLPKRALKFAQIEHRLGIKSTYFVRVHGEFYHPFDKINYQVFKKITQLGHEIGLHSEARTLGSNFHEKPLDLFKAEKKVLEEILGLKIESASEHADLGRPKNYWHKHLFTILSKEQAGISNYPQEKRFQEYHYLSDSSGRWPEGCLCQNLNKYSKLQVLIHADLWGQDATKERNNLLKIYHFK